jgi:hypothetical protein
MNAGASLTGLMLRPLFSRLEQLHREQRRLQDQVARRLARRFAPTRLGAHLGLAGVAGALDLQRRCPLAEYEQLRPHLERPLYWGMTNGTTGGMKAIPITRELLRENARGFSLQLGTILQSRGRFDLLLGKTFYLGSSASIERGDDGVPRGYITAITVREWPRLFRSRVIPGDRLDAMATWNEKVDALVDMAPRHDVRIVSGMPPWLLAFARRFAARQGVDVRTVWPNLGAVITSGSAIAPYAAELAARFGAVDFRSVYTATEGLLAIQESPGAPLLPLADSVFFELVPVDDLAAERPRRVLLADAEPGQEYAIVCATFGGLFGYLIGDTVRVVSRDPVRFQLSGRTRQRASIAGEKVSIDEVEQVALRATSALGLELSEVALVPMRTEGQAPFHLWLVELRNGAVSPPALAEALDRELSALNETYRVWRRGDTPPLGPPQARLLRFGAFARSLERSGRVGGQHKVPRILAEVPPDLESMSPEIA